MYDSHEYFTQVPELINRPRVQKIWENIEKRILPKVKYAYRITSYNVCYTKLLRMPGTDGLQATLMIREYEKKNSNFPVAYIAAVTANSLSKYKDECLDAGMDNFLSKPFSEKELITILQEGLKVKANECSVNYE